MATPNRDPQHHRSVGLILMLGLAALLVAVLWGAGYTRASPMWMSAAGQGSSPLQQNPVITVGVAAALSGPADWLGWQEANAVQLAISQTNAAGGIEIGGITYTVVLVMADDMCNQTLAITAANTLLDAGAVAVVGHTCSGASFAAQPLDYTAGVAMVSPSSTAPELTEQGYDTTFRVVARDDAGPIRLASYFRGTLGLDRAAIVERSGSPGFHPDAFESTFTSLGGTITSRRLVTSTADYTATLLAIQPENPGAIFYADSDAQAAGLLSRIAHGLGMGDVTMGWDALWEDDGGLGPYVAAAGPGARGAVRSARVFPRCPPMPSPWTAAPSPRPSTAASTGCGSTSAWPGRRVNR